MKRAGILLLLVGCAHGPGPGEVRFENRPIVWRVDDRTPFDAKPEERKFNRKFLLFEASIAEPVDRALAVPDPVPAMNVNALDEVPDSSWFDNRLLRGLTAEQVRAGPIDDSAENLKPWKVISTKVGGRSLGFVVEDSRGRKYLLKFDDPGFPELKTGAGVVVQRLMWALGYHVPVDDVVTFSEDDLILAKDAVEKGAGDAERPLDQERFKELLAMADREGDRFRGLISKMLPGEALGGYAMEGTREDDPNDVIPHQHRRDLRAHWTFFAWVDHTDWKEDNRLDMWIGDKTRGHLEHYILDFDKALGVMAFVSPREADGYVHGLDPGYAFLSLASFGLWVRPWERIQMTHEDARRGVGRFESVVFEPDLWRPRLPEPAFSARDRFDDFWAAKRMMMLTPEHIRAAVQAGKYSDPLVERYLFDTLIERRSKLARAAFSKVTPLDQFVLREDEGKFSVCFDDLWVRHGFGAERQYVIRQYSDDGEWISEQRARGSKGTVCSGSFSPERYNIVMIEVGDLEPVELHVARRGGKLHIVGLVRKR